MDDLVQETFIIAFQKAHKYDEKKGEARSWLYGIAANLCRRFGRSRQRAGRFSSRLAQYVECQPDLEEPEHTMIREEEIAIVRRAVQKLPFKQREVFVLYELEGMAGKDIGKLLKLKEGTVWTRLHYARKSFTTTLRKMVLNEK